MHVTNRLCDCCYVVRKCVENLGLWCYVWACPSEACRNYAGAGSKLPDWYSTEKSCYRCYRITYRRKPDRGTDLWGCDTAGCRNHRATIALMNCDACGYPHFKELRSVVNPIPEEFDLEIHNGIREFATDLMAVMRASSYEFREGRYRVTVERVKPLIRMIDMSDVE